LSGFNVFEKYCSILLNRFPGIKYSLKNAYQRVNYCIFADKSFSYTLSSDWMIQSPYEWAGVSEPENNEELFFGYYDKSPCSKDMKKAVFPICQDSCRLP
jgi:hypothetical protein